VHLPPTVGGHGGDFAFLEACVCIDHVNHEGAVAVGLRVQQFFDGFQGGLGIAGYFEQAGGGAGADLREVGGVLLRDVIDGV
jgi:hypothetical protein